MLRIGFANQYFTLWDVSKTFEWNAYGGYDKYHFWYLKNLSKDKDAAIEKAKAEGCTDLEVDEDLRGRSQSWSRKSDRYTILPRSLNPFFEFGKYADFRIDEVDDFNYKVWYYGATYNRYCKAEMIESGDWVEVDGELIDKAEANRRAFHKSWLRKRQVVVDVLTNINPSRNSMIVEDQDGNDFELIWPEGSYGLYYYKDWAYGLPKYGMLHNGVCKRVKGKTITVTKEGDKVINWEFTK